MDVGLAAAYVVRSWVEDLGAVDVRISCPLTAWTVDTVAVGSYVRFHVVRDSVSVHVYESSGGSPECRHCTPSALLTTPPPKRDREFAVASFVRINRDLRSNTT